MAQSAWPAEDVVADTYVRTFPDTGARIAVFEAGRGFREELLARDTAGVFDTLMPGQPPLTQADIIIARVDDWPEAAEVYQDTPLHPLSVIAHDMVADQSVLIEQSQIFGSIDVVTFTVLNEADGEVVHARCMARLVIDTLYAGNPTDFDLAVCSRELR
ncbi:hypothetical protein [Gymnodinialimonas ulvae]|uniref:hypothetical protein n=1 Tax=Gymnodinialimonas ulvae TaxID=3126504 RepID=UPI0030A5A3E4